MGHSARTQQRSGGWLIHGFIALLVTIGVALSIAVLPAAALASSSPSIEWTNAWNLSPSDVTLGAGIDVAGLPRGAYYQFQVVKNTSEYLSELACPEPSLQSNSDDGCNSPDSPVQPTAGALPIGFIAKGPESQSVSQSLTAAGITLQPGTTYHSRSSGYKAKTGSTGRGRPSQVPITPSPRPSGNTASP